MKIGDSRALYMSQINAYNKKRFELSTEKKELDEKIKNTENGSVIYMNESSKLDLSLSALSDKQDEYQNYLDQLTQQWTARFDQISADQSADATSEYVRDMGKVITIAKRIMHGDIVPSGDEKKLMEFNKDLYIMAKNIGSMVKLEERKKYKSLWDDEETNTPEDPSQAADDQEAVSGAPEIVSVDDTLAGAGSGTTSGSGSASVSDSGTSGSVTV